MLIIRKRFTATNQFAAVKLQIKNQRQAFPAFAKCYKLFNNNWLQPFKHFGFSKKRTAAYNKLANIAKYLKLGQFSPNIRNAYKLRKTPAIATNLII